MSSDHTEKNVVKLFPKTGKTKKPVNSFETPFLRSSKIDGSSFTFEVFGPLAYSLRRDALSVGKDAESYAAEWVDARYKIDGGIV